jgi:hypothetical protein
MPRLPNGLKQRIRALTGLRRRSPFHFYYKDAYGDRPVKAIHYGMLCVMPLAQRNGKLNRHKGRVSS